MKAGGSPKSNRRVGVLRASALPSLKQGPIRRERVGRRLSRREVEVHQTDSGDEIYLEQLAAHQQPFNLAQLRARAVDVLEAGGIEATSILHAEPGGSSLRDSVLNGLGHAQDSKLGLAAQICELCIRLAFFIEQAAPPSRVAAIGYRLGWLMAMNRLYEAEDAQIGDAQKAGAEARRVYTEAEKQRWRDLRDERFSRHTTRRSAELVAEHLSLPKEAFETIRKALGVKTGRPD